MTWIGSDIYLTHWCILIPHKVLTNSPCCYHIFSAATYIIAVNPYFWRYYLFAQRSFRVQPFCCSYTILNWRMGNQKSRNKEDSEQNKVWWLMIIVTAQNNLQPVITFTAQKCKQMMSVKSPTRSTYFLSLSTIAENVTCCLTKSSTILTFNIYFMSTELWNQWYM